MCWTVYIFGNVSPRRLFFQVLEPRAAGLHGMHVAVAAMRSLILRIHFIEIERRYRNACIYNLTTRARRDDNEQDVMIMR